MTGRRWRRRPAVRMSASCSLATCCSVCWVAASSPRSTAWCLTARRGRTATPLLSSCSQRPTTSSTVKDSSATRGSTCHSLISSADRTCGWKARGRPAPHSVKAWCPSTRAAERRHMDCTWRRRRCICSHVRTSCTPSLAASGPPLPPSSSSFCLPHLAVGCSRVCSALRLSSLYILHRGQIGVAWRTEDSRHAVQLTTLAHREQSSHCTHRLSRSRIRSRHTAVRRVDTVQSDDCPLCVRTVVTLHCRDCAEWLLTDALDLPHRFIYAPRPGRQQRQVVVRLGSVPQQLS